MRCTYSLERNDNKKEIQKIRNNRFAFVCSKSVCTFMWRHDAAFITDVNTEVCFTWRENQWWHRFSSVSSAPGKVTVSGQRAGYAKESWWSLPSRWPAACPTDWPKRSATTASLGKKTGGARSVSVRTAFCGQETLLGG